MAAEGRKRWAVYVRREVPTLGGSESVTLEELVDVVENEQEAARLAASNVGAGLEAIVRDLPEPRLPLIVEEVIRLRALEDAVFELLEAPDRDRFRGALRRVRGVVDRKGGPRG